MKVRNTSDHVVDLDDGRVLAPGERAETDDSDRTKQLIEADLLVEENADVEVSSGMVTEAPPVAPVPTNTAAPDSVVVAPTPEPRDNAPAPTDQKEN